jgi:hypothetical protein
MLVRFCCTRKKVERNALLSKYVVLTLALLIFANFLYRTMAVFH